MTMLRMARQDVEKTTAMWENWQKYGQGSGVDVELMIGQLIGSQVMLLRAIEEQAKHRHRNLPRAILSGLPRLPKVRADGPGR